MPKKNEPDWMKKGREKAERAAKEKVEKTTKECQEIIDKAKDREKS